MKRRSFAIPGEIESKLTEIKQLKKLDNTSEAMRFCVDHTYENLLFQPPAELISTLEKNSILLRYLLIEVIKIHGGKTQISETSKKYLKHINTEISEHIKRKIGE